MEEKDIEYFRNLLIKWMEELLDHADDTVEGLLNSQENLADPMDRATVESAMIRTLRLRDRESMLKKKSDDLWRMSKTANMVYARIAARISPLND